MEEELAEHVGVAPALQQGFLGRRELAALAAAGELGFGERGAEVVDAGDAEVGQGLERVALPGFAQGEEALQVLHRERREIEGADAGGEVFDGFDEGVPVHAFGEAERGLERGVEAVAARVFGDGGDVGQAGLEPRGVGFGVAAEPGGGGFVERVVDGWGVVKRDAHQATRSPPRQTCMTMGWPSWAWTRTRSARRVGSRRPRSGRRDMRAGLSVM